MKYLFILLLLVSCSNVERSPAIEEEEQKTRKPIHTDRVK